MEDSVVAPKSRALLHRKGLLFGLTAGGLIALFLVYPLINEGTSGTCSALESRLAASTISPDDESSSLGAAILTGLSRGNLAAGWVRQHHPLLPVFVGCAVDYWGIVNRLPGQKSAKQSDVAREQIDRINGVLDLYKLDVGSYPGNDQGLAALITKPDGVDNWSGPYLKGVEAPLDPWGKQWVYRNPSGRQGKDYDLCSRGAEGLVQMTVGRFAIDLIARR